MDIFFDTTLEDTIKLSPSQLTQKKDDYILQVLKTSYEGTCSKFGYIKRNSIKLVNVSMGAVELATFHGYMLFQVLFSASICNPSVGSVIQCNVHRMNSFGMLCIAVTKNDETGKDEQIMNIAVPKHLSRNENAFIEDIQIGDTVLIEIIGKKYELKNTSISSIGKVIVDKSKEIKLDDTTSKLVIPDDEDGEIETIDDEVDSFSEHSDIEETAERELSELDDEDSDNESEDSVDEY
tara:strand:+ start:644 stop:1354 length:711 start_codon:yes stop_codon:yes gene_type:complete